MCAKVDKKSKNFICLFRLIFFFVLLSLSIFPQFDKNEKLKAQISELIPSHSFIKSCRNFEIVGFDVLNHEEIVLSSKKFSFLPGDYFYVVLYGRRKIFKSKSPQSNFFPECKASMEHQNGAYFWSIKILYPLQNLEDKVKPVEWEIGGLYKIKFAFRVPSLVLPGKFRLRIFEEKIGNPLMGSLIDLDEIKINIEKKKGVEIKRNRYNLPLNECLLNPAVVRKDCIYFYWTGNVEYFFSESLENYSKIIISAMGTPAYAIYPLLKLYIGEKEVGNMFIKDQWRDYEFDLKPKKNSHILKIRFDNDTKEQGQDRNMRIKKIELIK